MKLIEMLKLQESSLAKMRSELPRVYHKQYSMRCPWSVKGALMRYLVEKHSHSQLELVDGVKIFNQQSQSRDPRENPGEQVTRKDNWVLILPNAGEPRVHIVVNSNDRVVVDLKLWEYRTLVDKFVEADRER